MAAESGRRPERKGHAKGSGNETSRELYDPHQGGEGKSISNLFS